MYQLSPKNPLPPVNNMGGKFNKLTRVDWLAFTIPSQEIDGSPSPEFAFSFYVQPLLSDFGWSFEMREGGRNFYRYSADVIDGFGRVVGFLAYGGNRGTLNVCITGVGCSQLSNSEFSLVAEYVRARYCKITRVDICFDFDGDFWQQRDMCLSSLKTGGNLPSVKTIDDHDSGEGKTFYAGKRVNGKMFRLYEKGRQLGDENSSWLRAEVEINCKSRVIPYDVLVCPDSFFTGAYGFCFHFVKVFPSKIKTISKQAAKIACDVLVDAARVSYGKLINVLSGVYSSAELVLLLSREGIPRRLAICT